MDENYFSSTSLPDQMISEQKHSGFGLASFIISVLAGIGMVGLFVVAGVIESGPEGFDEESATAMVVGLALFFFLFVDLIALILGVVGLAQQNRKKVYAVLGMVFSGLTILGTVGLVILGLSME